MEQWSIHSNKLKYIQYDRYPKNYHSLGITAMNKCGKNPTSKEEETDILELDSGQTLYILREEYLNFYEGIQSEILSTKRFDENSDLHSTLPIMKKKYAEILLHYRWLFVKGDVIIGEWEIFSAEVFLCYSQFFIKGNFVIGGVECKYHIVGKSREN